MVGSFKHKGLRRLYEDGDSRGVIQEHVEKLETILAALEAAVTVEELRRPSFRLHILQGRLAGKWAITVRANWRVVFEFTDGQAFGIDYVDYH